MVTLIMVVWNTGIVCAVKKNEVNLCADMGRCPTQIKLKKKKKATRDSMHSISSFIKKLVKGIYVFAHMLV